MKWTSKVITFLLINSFTVTIAQKTQDILVLKNGSSLKGKIVSVDTNTGGASIEIAGGSVFVFKKDEIAEIKLNGDTLAATRKDRRGENVKAISKFRSEIGLGGMFGNSSSNYYYYSSPATGHFNIASSYAINKYIEAGVRVGIFGLYGTNLGLAGTTTFTIDNTKKHVPFLSLASGACARSNRYYYYDFAGTSERNKPAFWGLAELGLKTYITNNFGIGYSFGMNYLQFKETYYDWSGFETTTNYKTARYFLKFSILF